MMAGLEEQLSGILNNPQMMGQLMDMARSFGFSPPSGPGTPSPEPPSGASGPELSQLLSQVSGGGLDQRQEALLQALQPYLSPGRVNRLRQAMRTAHMAQVFSSAMGSSNPMTGR